MVPLFLFISDTKIRLFAFCWQLPCTGMNGVPFPDFCKLTSYRPPVKLVSPGCSASLFVLLSSEHPGLLITLKTRCPALGTAVWLRCQAEGRICLIRLPKNALPYTSQWEVWVFCLPLQPHDIIDCVSSYSTVLFGFLSIFLHYSLDLHTLLLDLSRSFESPVLAFLIWFRFYRVINLYNRWKIKSSELCWTYIRSYSSPFSCVLAVWQWNDLQPLFRLVSPNNCETLGYVSGTMFL